MFESKFSEFRSKFVVFQSTDRSGRGGRSMSSVASAHKNTRELSELLAPGLKVEAQLDKLYRELTKHYPEIKSFTRRRVRAFFFGEARRADYEEVAALEELKAQEEARLEHLEFVATTTRMAAALAQEGAALSRKQMEVLERIARRQVGVPGNSHSRAGGSFRPMAVSGIDGDAR